MTTYYASSRTGSSGNNGTTYALAKATINQALALVAAGDTVYVDHGVYRETVASTVNGTSGSKITIIADITGENTDGIGGCVLVTGSDNDTSTTRNNCFSITHDYHVIRGFMCTGNNDSNIAITCNFNASNVTIEDCFFDNVYSCIQIDGGGSHTIRRCTAFFRGGSFVQINNSGGSSLTAENNVSLSRDGIHYDCRATATIQNNESVFGGTGIYCPFAFTATVRQCLFTYTGTVYLTSNASAVITANYCNSINHGTLSDASGGGTITTGANSTTVLSFHFPWTLLGTNPYELHSSCTLRDKTDSGTAPTDNLYGLTRSVTNGLRDWGPVDVMQTEIVGKETTTTRTGSTALYVNGFGCREYQVGVTASSSITISVYVKWDSNATIGAKPKLEISGCGLSSSVQATGDGSSSWEQLTLSSLSPTATGIAKIRLWNAQTETANKRKVYFDDLAVT